MTATLNNEQVEELIMKLAESNEDFTEEEANILVKWADEALTNVSILDLIFNNKLNVKITDGQVVVSRKG